MGGKIWEDMGRYGSIWVCGWRRREGRLDNGLLNIKLLVEIARGTLCSMACDWQAGPSLKKADMLLLVHACTELLQASDSSLSIR